MYRRSRKEDCSRYVGRWKGGDWGAVGVVCVLGSGTDDRKTLGEMLAVDRLVTRGTLGRRVRVTEVGTHTEESAV